MSVTKRFKEFYDTNKESLMDGYLKDRAMTDIRNVLLHYIDRQESAFRMDFWDYVADEFHKEQLENGL